MTAEESSTLIRKGPCEACGSSDANAEYSDGHTHCFSCGHHTGGDGARRAPLVSPKVQGKLIEDADFQPLSSRDITAETCRKMGYGVARYKGHPVHVANYYDDSGQIVAQKIRGANKDFRVLGDIADALPFGAHAWPRTGRSIVVTEGEIDALSMSQAQGNRYPVVSIACGAEKDTDADGMPTAMNKIKRYFGKHRDYFLGFEKVILMFDSDAPGIASARAAAEVIGHSAHIATLPLKDANEMLVAGRVSELVDAMWRAKRHQPDGIVAGADLRDEVLAGVEPGAPWAWHGITDLTHGRRLGEIYMIGAGTGVGKTHLLTQQIAFDISELRVPTGVLFLEQGPPETMRRLLGVLAGKPFHLPEGEGGYTQEQLLDAWDKMDKECAPVTLYRAFGAATWEDIEARIRFMAHAEGCKHIYLDHLTALAAAEDDERRALERIMSEMSALALELDIVLHVVSHLATPEHGSHEEGARVTIRHFKGSRAIGFWSHYMFGLERNQQANDEAKRMTTTVRLLKARYDGSKVGQCVALRFDPERYTLEEVTDFGPDMSDNSDLSPGDSPGDFTF